MFFFFSGTKLSWMRYMTMYSFRKMNPTWEIVFYHSNVSKDYTSDLFVNNPQDFIGANSGKDYLSLLPALNIDIREPAWPEKYKNQVAKLDPVNEADLYRLYQLSIDGGFYCDTDVLFFRSMDDLYSKVSGFDVLYHEYPANDDTGQWWMTVGFLACTPGSRFFLDLFELGITDLRTDNYQSNGVLLFYRLLKNKNFTRIGDKLKTLYPEIKFYNMPTDIIYYYDWLQIEKCWNNKFGIESFPRESIGYHWFGGHKASQKFNVLLNEENFHEHKNTFTKIAGQVKKKPLISIVTAYYNRKKQFINTLDSIKNSSIKDIEVIVVDDGSDTRHRLEDLLTDYPFLKIIRRAKSDKWNKNPCIPFNIGIQEAQGDIIMLQNPECKHYTDVLSHALNNVNNSNYISYCTYALTQGETFKDEPIYFDTERWYNHHEIRPTYYHFCSAITKANMDKVNGFDERYAMGFDYDDNELVTRLHRLGLNMIITGPETMVLHQYHDGVFYNQDGTMTYGRKINNFGII